MKKNISINISGIIFHIEEDGYENLRKYLDSINKYFASFEDSSEILADIESRVAEIFLVQIKRRQAGNYSGRCQLRLLLQWVVSAILKLQRSKNLPNGTRRSTTILHCKRSVLEYIVRHEQKTYTSPKQLLRDEKRKILGGVCSGMANYFNVDPIWIRLLFALTAFAYGITILVYIVMWIVVPGSPDLEEPEVGKENVSRSRTKSHRWCIGWRSCILWNRSCRRKIAFFSLYNLFWSGFHRLCCSLDCVTRS